MRLLIIFVLVLTGLAPVGEAKVSNVPAVSGRVADPIKLKHGGKLGLVPLTPGVKASAGEETDRAAMMIIKGITESLQAHLTVVTVTDKQEEADFVMDGFIDELSRKRLAVSGEIWWRDNGVKVLTVKASRKISARENFAEAAYDTGRAIGDFIVAQSSGEQM